MAKDLEWFAKDYGRLSAQVSEMEKKLGTCSICSEKIDIEELNVMCTEAKTNSDNAIKIAGIAITITLAILALVWTHITKI